MPAIIRNAIDSLPSYWKLATIRCGLYALIVGWGVWKAGINGFATLADMTPLQFWQLVGDVLMSMAGVWLAFIDNTMGKIPENQNQPEVPATNKT